MNFFIICVDKLRDRTDRSERLIHTHTVRYRNAVGMYDFLVFCAESFMKQIKAGKSRVVPKTVCQYQWYPCGSQVSVSVYSDKEGRRYLLEEAGCAHHQKSTTATRSWCVTPNKG